MRILLHDYGGYGFTSSLARRLAGLGHEVHYLYASENPTPHGLLEEGESDWQSLHIRPIELGWKLKKYSYLRRWIWEVQYGRRLASKLQSIKPDVCVSANAPIDSQAFLLRRCERLSVPFVHWAQDLVGRAMNILLRGRWWGLGSVVGSWYERRELRMMARSEQIIAISHAFAEYLWGSGISKDQVHVLPNWAPLSSLPTAPKDNPWARRHGLVDSFVFLYTGTLGLKHDPRPLLNLADHFSGGSEAQVLVISQGPGADWLRGKMERLQLQSVRVLPLQPMEHYPQVLASSDVLIGLLNPDAGKFSVPSKVLSYLCAERPILLSVPEANPAGRIVAEAGAGMVVPPEDKDALLGAAGRLMESTALRRQMGRRGREYAERHFNEDEIAGRFAALLSDAVSKG